MTTTTEPEVEAGPPLADMLATGATYRQLDYWVRRGWLCDDNPDPGSGYNRRWSERDLLIVGHMIRLTRAGVAAHVAVEWARDAVDHGRYVQTYPGVTIRWRATK